MTKRALLMSAAMILSACATSHPAPQPKPAGGGDTELATRITRICALPQSERDKEIAKLKKESGLVLYCGTNKK